MDSLLNNGGFKNYNPFTGETASNLPETDNSKLEECMRNGSITYDPNACVLNIGKGPNVTISQTVNVGGKTLKILLRESGGVFLLQKQTILQLMTHHFNFAFEVASILQTWTNINGQ